MLDGEGELDVEDNHFAVAKQRKTSGMVIALSWEQKSSFDD